MKKIVRLTENDLARIVKRVISEQGNAKGPAGYGDYIVNENFNGATGGNVWASLGSTVEPMMLPNGMGKPKDQFGNKITVNADYYYGKSGAYEFKSKETVVFYQICGAESNFMAKDTINSVLTGGSGYYSKYDGPIQKKLVASCKSQGYKGQFQNGKAKLL